MLSPFLGSVPWTVSLLYKSSFIPTILYNCSVWASATSRKKIVKSLKSAQRPFALIIGRLFKSTCTEAALVLANIIPLHLKVLEIVAKRSLSALSELLPGSSQLLVGDIPNRIRSAATPSGLSLRTHRERMIRSEVFSLWNSTWDTATTGKQTRLFFPSVELAFILSSSKFPLFLCSFLSGHCILNDFLFKIKKSSSPSCSCLKGDETVHHVIFDCLEYATHRSALIMCATGHELSWPVPLSTFAQHKPMWVALIIFLRDIQRFLWPHSLFPSSLFCCVFNLCFYNLDNLRVFLLVFHVIMPRNRSSHSRRATVVYVHVPANIQQVIITTEVEIVHDPVPPSSPPISPVSEDTATTPSLNQDDFDGILLHGDEF